MGKLPIGKIKLHLLMKSGYEQCYFCITENRIAAILLKEAAERRRQAGRDGIHVFLQHPKVRGRSNSRFPAATVLGVQAVEVNEMWRVRQKEMELNDRLKSRSNDHSGNSRIVWILASLIEAEIGGMRAMLVLHAHQAKQ
ncbi:hypothetical protein Goari_018546 [Gossypium aridum]|uniref:Uncharacterized protein n=1 Tax=Gossypium aridum TaxID=34290 RepID=A0A7J8WQ00_GOSAI|nr:hypothetical protein [Gossypium aridum]